MNMNLTNCVVKTTAWGKHIITNVCSGETYTVPWGIEGYALVGVMGFIVLMAILLIISAFASYRRV